MQFSGSKVQVPFVFQCCVFGRDLNPGDQETHLSFLSGMLYVGFPKLVSDLRAISIECDLNKGLGNGGRGGHHDKIWLQKCETHTL